MGSDTTIPVSHETKELLADEKRDGETWDAALRRLVEGETPDSEVLDRLVDLERAVSNVPSDTADQLERRLR